MNDYRNYIRNYHIDDEQYNIIIDDLLNEIAYITNIWKKEFWFDVIPNEKYYDLNALLSMYETNEYSTIVDEVPDGYDPDTKDYSKSIANIIDVRYMQKKLINFTEPTVVTRNISALGSDFEYENMFTLRYIGEDLEDLYEYKRYIALVSIVPTQEQVAEMRETLVSKCIIAGLKYKVGSMYDKQANDQYIQFLKQNYEYELKQLQNIQPVNAFWQKKQNTKGFLV